MIFNRKTSVPVLGALVPALALGILGCDEEKKTSWNKSERAAACAPGDIYGRQLAPNVCSRFGRRCDGYMYPAGHEANCSDGQTNVVRGIHPTYTAFIPCHVQGDTCVAKFTCGDSPGTCDPSRGRLSRPEPCADGRIRENRICVLHLGPSKIKKRRLCGHEHRACPDSNRYTRKYRW